MSVRGDNWNSGCTAGARVICDGNTGRVVKVTPRSFVAEFPYPAPMPALILAVAGSAPIATTLTHFSRRFRRKDGRSLGGKIVTWASKTHPIAQSVPAGGGSNDE